MLPKKPDFQSFADYLPSTPAGEYKLSDLIAQTKQLNVILAKEFPQLVNICYVGAPDYEHNSLIIKVKTNHGFYLVQNLLAEIESAFFQHGFEFAQIVLKVKPEIYHSPSKVAKSPVTRAQYDALEKLAQVIGKEHLLPPFEEINNSSSAVETNDDEDQDWLIKL
ncbi:MAG: hypothetical protein RLZZ293_1281 [Pseudomonadota bacterium]|jgi:hypothetical protein